MVLANCPPSPNPHPQVSALGGCPGNRPRAAALSDGRLSRRSPGSCGDRKNPGNGLRDGTCDPRGAGQRPTVSRCARRGRSGCAAVLRTTRSSRGARRAAYGSGAGGDPQRTGRRGTPRRRISVVRSSPRSDRLAGAASLRGEGESCDVSDGFLTWCASGRIEIRVVITPACWSVVVEQPVR